MYINIQKFFLPTDCIDLCVCVVCGIFLGTNSDCFLTQCLGTDFCNRELVCLLRSKK